MYSDYIISVKHGSIASTTSGAVLVVAALSRYIIMYPSFPLTFISLIYTNLLGITLSLYHRPPVLSTAFTEYNEEKPATGETTERIMNKKLSSHPLVWGTLLLTLTGLISPDHRLFLSNLPLPLLRGGRHGHLSAPWPCPVPLLRPDCLRLPDCHLQGHR